MSINTTNPTGATAPINATAGSNTRRNYINPTKVITGPNTRMSYLNAWEPKAIDGGKPKYSASLIIPKDDVATIEKIKAALKQFTAAKVDINIAEIKSPDMDAILVARNIADQLERRIAFRRAMKQCVGRTMRTGAKGIKVMVSGRLGGAEIARSESYREGSIPLHTLRADIDYGTAEAHTTYGRIGVKVWIFKGEVLPARKQAAAVEGSEA